MYHYFDKSECDGDRLQLCLLIFWERVKHWDSATMLPTLAIVQTHHGRPHLYEGQDGCSRGRQDRIEHLHKIAHQFDIGVYFEATDMEQCCSVSVSMICCSDFRVRR